MGLPLNYSLRNMRRRPLRTAMTVLGIAVVIFAAVLMLALSRGLFSRLDVTGSSDNLLIISRKGQNAMFSNIEAEEVNALLAMPHLASDAQGKPLISPEILHVATVSVPATGLKLRAPVTLRGVDPIAYDVHDSLRVTDGQLPRPTGFEVLVGSMAHIKLGVPAEAVAVGEKIEFEGLEWTVVGHFVDSGSLIESEIWVPQEAMMTFMRRRTHSLVVVKFESPEDAHDATALFSQSGAIERYFKGWSERGYYRQFTDTLAWIFWLSVFMVCLVALAGVLIGVNTMYTAIVSRMGEIATQRILGFTKLDITVSLLAESVMIALVGGALGCAAGYILDDMPMKLSQGAFSLSVDWLVVVLALGLAAITGVLGALLPTVKSLRLSIIEALHYE